MGLPLVQRTPTKFLLSSTNPIGVEAVIKSQEGDEIELSLRSELNKCGESGEHLQVFEVEKIYVLTGGGTDEGPGHEDEKKQELQYSFIRRRSQKGFSVYGHTTVSTHPSGERVEVKRIITKREYEWMKSMYADASRNVIIQKRYCFLWQGKTYSLYRYMEPLHSLFILHCQAAWSPKESLQPEEGVDETHEVIFPPFLNVTEPLNEDGKFSAYHISLKSATHDSPTNSDEEGTPSK